jgi:hypothetical protein
VASLHERLGPALEALEARGLLAGWEIRSLPASRPPWTATGLRPAAGQAVSWLAEGRIVAPWMPTSPGGPRFHLWGRFAGEGPIFCGTRETTTRVAPRAGPLELGVYQGEWPEESGAAPAPAEAWAALEGGFEVALLLWPGGEEAARAGLEALHAATGDALVARERERLRAPVLPPAGWRYLWLLGESEIFRPAREAGEDAIEIDARGDVGILQHRLERPFPVDEGTRLRWRWRVDELPSREAEDALLHHDYVSVAAEFACGRDLTWYWSAALPEGAHYTCPIPQWAPREHHFVIRSGGEGLGRWHAEERAIAPDYRAVHGAPVPEVVALWLIAVSIFQGGRARARFAGIELVGRQGGVRVL